jgi:hypothetical protein
MRVPSGGFVLSGHGHARVWLTNNAQVGDTITQLPGSSCNAPAPTPTETVTPTSTPATGLDVHGIKMLRPTIADGIVWTSNWTTARTFTSGSFDPQDPWMRGTGSGTYKAGGGEMKISGSTPRLYLRDPNNVRQWRDVEITTYFKRVADDNTAYAGMVAVARTNHLPDANRCDTRGYGARMRNDGKLDFAKETKHPTWVTASTKTQWSTGGLPKNQWLGYKFLVYDLPTGNVKVELYLDTTDGLNGGTWQLINSYEDTGSTWGVGSQGCAAGIDPTLRLTKASSRPGSETGRPNASIYFRSTNVSTDGLIYKKASVREIDVN